jgi:tetratricopeptide (TPR) repeat protein
VETNLLERALYQVIRASLAADDLPKATNALAKLLAWYPRGFHAYTDGALLLTGQAVSQQGDPAAARDLYLRFARSATNSSLLPQIGLAVARTYEEENNWPAAISQYKQWLATYSNSVLWPSAEYYCGWANSQAGNYTNALICFTNLVARFPLDNDFAPLAQLWVADYYYGVVRDLVKAEGKYIDLYRNTNWHRPELSYQAYLMAGRAALNVGSYSDAINNFTNLTSNPSCPPRFWTSAMLAYGETLMSRESTNSLEKMADYRTASLIFDQVSARFPTNPVALLALYRKGCCLLQRSEFEEGGGAISAFSQILTNSLADASIRSKAALGLAATFEAQAKTLSGADLTNLLDRALGLYLDVLHGSPSILRPGEARDIFWTQKAGMEAARLLENEKKWDDAIRAYQEMIELFPPLRPDLEKRVLRAQKNQAS